MTDEERQRRREERAAEVKRRQKRALVMTGVALIVLAVAALVVRSAWGSNAAPSPEGTEPVDPVVVELDRLRAQKRKLERRVRRQKRRIRRQRVAFRYALRTSSVGNDWIERAFLCVHSYERGADGWQTNTGNGYDGGLQMDKAFQRAHGARFLAAFGPAYRWPRSVQIAVAIDGWITRGFQPWPRTARECGLL